MEKRTFGRSGVRVPVIGQGTWRMEHDNRQACITSLRRALDLGVTHIDTAELYGGGYVEELVGEALNGRRDEAFLVSKVRPDNATYDGTIRACEDSLKRLGTDRLDCYLLHWPGSYPLESTIAAFEALERSGKILSWGVSNFDVTDLEHALRIAGEGRITCNQVLYHLGERAIEHAVLPWCRRHGVAVVAYSPFGAGPFVDLDTPQGQVLVRIAERHGATPRQVALRFLLRDYSVLTIPKATQLAHLEDNAGAGKLQLETWELDEIDRAFGLGTAPSELPVM